VLAYPRTAKARLISAGKTRAQFAVRPARRSDPGQ
jgi:hypothetical protein